MHFVVSVQLLSSRTETTYSNSKTITGFVISAENSTKNIEQKIIYFHTNEYNCEKPCFGQEHTRVISQAAYLLDMPLDGLVLDII